MADGEVPGDISLRAKPGTKLKDVAIPESAVAADPSVVGPEDFSTDLEDALPPPGRGPILVVKPLSPNAKEYIQFADGAKKPGDVLSDEECELLGLPKGSVVPDFSNEPLPPSFRPKPTDGPPPFTLDEEAELPGEENVDPEGSTPAHHTKEHEEYRDRMIGSGPTVAQVATEAKAFFEELIGQGFTRAEALELTKEVVKVRAKE